MIDSPPHRRSGLLRVLPLLVLAFGGWLLWRSPLFPQPRTLVWEVPPEVGLRELEVQLWAGDALVARSVWNGETPGGFVQHLSLRPGRYRAIAFAHRADGRTAQGASEMDLGAEEMVHVPVRALTLPPGVP